MTRMTNLSIPILILLACGRAATAEAQAKPSADTFRRAARALPGRYIAVLHDSSDRTGGDVSTTAARSAATSAKAAAYGLRPDRLYTHALHGFSFGGSESQARRLAQDPAVKYVIEDGVVTASVEQYGASWGLRRIDWRTRPVDNYYDYMRMGRGVHVYVIDSGIRITHQDFAGRASHDFTAVHDGLGAGDCLGHGTHVAGTIGGREWGVAKRVRLHSVRVFGCDRETTVEQVIEGVDWVTANHVQPAVANMSLGGGAHQALDDAVRGSIAAGVTYVLAAGNERRDACLNSPARVREALTVGATDVNDRRYGNSNFGTCLDLFAPGVNIPSAAHTSDTGSVNMTGTSMAAPHVAGVAALVLERYANITPAEVEQMIRLQGTPNVVAGPGTGSPNRLLYSFFTHYGDHYFAGDWDGDGRDNIAVWREGRWLMDTNFDWTPDIVQYYGGAEEFHVGDWDGDGRDNVALRRTSLMQMDTNFDGAPNINLRYGLGDLEDEYLTGDWDGDGRRNVAVRRGSCVLMDTNFDGLGDIQQCYGLGWREDQYLVGDWDGDGRDNLAVRRGNCVIMETNFDVEADLYQCYGNGAAEDDYLVGDWDGDGRDNLAVRRGTCVFMDTNFDEIHDLVQCYGNGNAAMTPNAAASSRPAKGD